MIRQLVLASCLVALVFSACTTIGPAIGGSCPSGYSLVTNNGQQECADAANAAACAAAGSGSGNTGSDCKDVQTNCANWSKNGFCSSTFYTATQKKASCAKTCGLC